MPKMTGELQGQVDFDPICPDKCSLR